MPSTYTNNLGVALMANGEEDGTWGNVTNENWGILDRATNGALLLALSGTSSNLITGEKSTSGVNSYGQYKVLQLTGSPSGTHTITILPNDAQKVYFVYNTTAQSVVFTQGSGGNVTLAAGGSGIIYSDGGGGSAAVVNLTNHFAMSSVKITGGSISGIADLDVTNLSLGGTAVTATAAELNILDGVTATASELNFVDGVTSAVQTQLDNRVTSNADDELTGGYTTTADNDGSFGSGTYTPTPAGGNMKRVVKTGAFTLAAPTAAGDYTMVLQITNSGSTGLVTLSGFSRTTGSAFTTTDGHDFFVYITKCNNFTLANVVALQ